MVFILCTTESHKIPVTIASRCQQFSFRSVDFDELVSSMRWICEQEGIQADDEALGILAQAGEGSVRDSLSALDQAIACCGNTLERDRSARLHGTVFAQSLQEVTDALARKRLAADAGNGQRTREERSKPAAFLPRALAVFPQSAGGADCGSGDQADRRLGGRAGAAAWRRRNGSAKKI